MSEDSIKTAGSLTFFNNGYREIRLGAISKLVMLLHGFGSNADDMIQLCYLAKEKLGAEYESLYFFAPNGLENLPVYSGYPSNYGYQWFDLTNRDVKSMKRNLEMNAPKIKESIKFKLEELNLSYKDLVLIGFSQGCMVALNIAVTLGKELGGVIGFSGALLPVDVEKVKYAHTPICLIHGEEDEVMPVEYMKQSKKFLESLNFNVEAHIIPNLSHSVDIAAINFAIDFIKKQLEPHDNG